MITYSDIINAYNRIKGVINNTPIMTSRTLNKITGANIFLKCENFQRVGAFKMRGAYNMISQLTEEEKGNGVIAHSSGNHAQAVALSAKILGIKATIVMPETSSQVKIDATKDTYGAEVILCENTMEARHETTQKLIEKYGYTLIHPYDNYNIIAGAGTAAYEFLNQIDYLDMMLAPIGGGGLMSGTLIATKGYNPKIKIYGVEPEIVDDAYRSLNSGEIESNLRRDSIADGLLTDLSQKTFEIIKKYIDGIVTVAESEILEAMKFLWERMKLVVEPSSACPLAAVLNKKISIKGMNIGIIISGGNIDLKNFFKEFENKI